MKCSQEYPYLFQLLQPLKPIDYSLRTNFAFEMLLQDGFSDCDTLFSNKWTLHIRGYGTIAPRLS